MKRALLAALLVGVLLVTIGAGTAAAQPTASGPTPADNATVFDPGGSPGDYEVTLEIRAGNLSSGATVTFYNAADNSTIATDTVSGSNGTATVVWDSTASSGAPTLGANEWFAEVDDGTSTTNSSVYAFTLPFFEVREETTGDPATGTFNVTFTTPFSGDVKELTSANNQIPLTNIPVDLTGQRLVDIDINSSSNDYYPRTLYVDDFGAFETAWMLRTNVTIVEATFELVDRTDGRFAPAQTALQITKPTRNQTQVAGEIFGADRRVTVRLAAGDRYRLNAINHDGETRLFGFYTASRANDFVELFAGSLSIEPEDADDYRIEARMTDVTVNGTTTPSIVVEYFDNRSVAGTSLPASTASMEVVIHERGNESNEIFNQTWTDTDVIRIQQTLTANQSDLSWTVRYDGLRYGGQEIRGNIPVGGLGALGIPIPAELLQVIGLGAILLVAGLFGGRLSQIGGIATICVAWVLWVVEIVVLPIEFLAAAAVVAILFYIGTPDSGGLYS